MGPQSLHFQAMFAQKEKCWRSAVVVLVLQGSLCKILGCLNMIFSMEWCVTFLLR